MNGISFHTARGQRITKVEFSKAVPQEEIDKQNEANRQAQEANDPTRRASESDDGKNARQRDKATAPVTDDHPTVATDPSASKAQVRFTLFGGETATVDADKLQFRGAAKGRAVDQRSGLPTIQIGNDGSLNNPADHRIDQAASLSDWLVQYYDWRDDETKWAVFDSATLHAITRRGAN